MASIKRSKNLVKINNSNQKLNSFNKNSSNQSEHTNSKEDNNLNYIEKSYLAELLKCDICNNLFDLNFHIPMVAKCGHTFCKKCILEKNLESKQPNQYEACPLDNIQNIFNIESCIVNLRIELLIKKIFNNPQSIGFQSLPQNQNQNIGQRQIVYSKPDIKKTRTSTNNNQNNNLNSHSPINKKNEEYGYKKLDTNSINNSIKKTKKNNEINDGLTSPKIEEEININNENKFLFEDEKINGVIINETIDTIPIYDEKSFCNVSFKEDVNELFAKNNISSKKAVINENNKKEINKNKNITSNNTKKKNKKKNNDLNVNQKPTLTKPISNFSLTPNKNKDNNQLLPVLEIQKNNNNNNNTDRDYNNENINNYKLINNKIILENNNYRDIIEKEKDDMSKYKNNTHKVRTVYDKIQLNLNGPHLDNYDYDYDFMDDKNIKENIMKNNVDLINNNSMKSSKNNNNIIVINKSKNKDNSKNKKDLYINTQYYPSKKIILFSNSNKNNNINRLSTNPNDEFNDKKTKKNIILNKNANILSTQILKKSNNNTIEAKNEVNLEELIKSSNKKIARNERNNFNSSDNDNENDLIKNRTYNSKKMILYIIVY